MALESIAQKAERLGAKDVTARFVKGRLKNLCVVASAPQEPTLSSDTIIYQDIESKEYYKFIRPRYGVNR